jgi:hypothetical protein
MEALCLFTGKPVKEEIVFNHRFHESFIFWVHKSGKSLSEIQHQANVKWSKLMKWYLGQVQAPHADEDLLNVARVLGASLEQLVFGVKA